MLKNFVPETAPLSQQLRELQRRSRAVLGHALIRHPAGGALRDLGQSLLARLKEIQQIWSTAAEDSEADICRQSLAVRLKQAHTLLDTVLDQIALCESTARQSLILLEWARRLVAQEHVRYQDLLPLFGHIFDEVQPIATLGRMIPVFGLPLASFVETETSETDAAIFITGLTAARILTWTLDDQPDVSERLSHLVLAALLEDIGRLMVTSAASAGRRFLAKRAAWLDRHHPSIGAGILGAIRGAPLGLGLMVSQHHERLDRGGFPRGLAPRDFHPDAAVLAAASRFAGICVAADGLPPAENTAGNAAFGAARKLLSEAEWGMWPIDFARHLSQRLTQTEEQFDAATRLVAHAIPEEPAEDCELYSPGLMDGDPQRQLHSRENRLQGTHTDVIPQSARVAGDKQRRIDKEPNGRHSS